jgi:two-component system response regulator YesN
MRKVLVVDDEKLIRIGIKTMIENKEQKFYDISLCSNGKEALELLMKENFDILITDIRMPQMDGITLMQEIGQINHKPQIIILSGYDDFNYASEALRSGAKDYLLKPVKRADLYASLDRVEKEIRIYEDHSKKVKMADSYIQGFQANELNYIFFKENISDNEIKEIGNKINMDTFFSDYYIGLLKKMDTIKNKKDETLKNMVASILESYSRNESHQVIMFFDVKENLVIFSKTKEVFNYLEKQLAKDNVRRIHLSVSENTREILGIKKAYNEAYEALKYSIFTQGNSMIYYSDVVNKNKTYKVPLDRIGKINNMIGTDRKDEIEKALDELLSISDIKAYSISYFEEINEGLYELILKPAKTKFFLQIENNIDDIDRVEENSLENIDKFKDLGNFRSFNEYFHELKDEILYISEYIKTMKGLYGEKNAIQQSIAYINENYHKDLNLAMVSNEVSLNYFYFSQLFKDTIGENFIDYVKKVRISKAKELLQMPEHKIYEVGKKVGYADSKQFAKIFRRVTGISPTEYREKSFREDSNKR